MRKWKVIVGIAAVVLIFAVAAVFTLNQMQKSDSLSSKAEFAIAQTDSYSPAANVVVRDYDEKQTIYSMDKNAAGNSNGMESIKSGASNPAQNNIEKKVIRNADVSVEVKKLDEDFNKISEWVKKNGGSEFSRRSSSNSRDKHINVVYKIPPEKLDAFIKFLAQTGTLLNSNVYSDDITDQYYDSAIRLENLKKGREQFLEIQKKATTIDALLKVQNELTRITGEIESLEGRLKMWDKMVAESTVNLYLSEQEVPIKVNKELTWNFTSPQDIWKTMKNGFIWTTNTLANIFVWLVIFVVAVIPVILIAALVVIIVKLIKKRKS